METLFAFGIMVQAILATVGVMLWREKKKKIMSAECMLEKASFEIAEARTRMEEQRGTLAQLSKDVSSLMMRENLKRL